GTLAKPVAPTRVEAPVKGSMRCRRPPSNSEPPPYSTPSGPNDRLAASNPVAPITVARPVVRFSAISRELWSGSKPVTPYSVLVPSHAMPTIGPWPVAPIAVLAPVDGTIVRSTLGPCDAGHVTTFPIMRAQSPGLHPGDVSHTAPVPFR